jgi:hypothetical protein
VASDASETLVLDQCALFALRCAVGAAQDREVSSQEIIGALRTAAKWALAHRHGAGREYLHFGTQSKLLLGQSSFPWDFYLANFTEHSHGICT